MNSVVCTLFEGHYHYGLAALTNSLYKSGYRGDIFAGYKGTLPFWSSPSQQNDSLGEGAKSMKIAEGLNLHFIEVVTGYHLTNYKPNFMIDVWGKYAKDAAAVVYFDPDIVVKCNWSFYENWLSHGIALVHEISEHDMPPTHPLRKEWAKVIEKAGGVVNNNLYSYINAGFCGVSIHYKEFLNEWIKILQTGIKYFNLTADQWDHNYDRTYIFYKQDQDALNITAMATTLPISEMGPEAMDFIHGGFTMSHAVGSPKPWKKNFILSAIKVNSPSLPDKEYWLNANYPIRIHSEFEIKTKKLAIKFCSILARFYKRP